MGRMAHKSKPKLKTKRFYRRQPSEIMDAVNQNEKKKTKRKREKSLKNYIAAKPIFNFDWIGSKSTTVRHFIVRSVDDIYSLDVKFV